MNIYNMEPLWVRVMEETKEKLGRSLTAEEINKIRTETRQTSRMLGLLYNQQFGLDGEETEGNGVQSILNNNAVYTGNTIPTNFV